MSLLAVEELAKAMHVKLASRNRANSIQTTNHIEELARASSANNANSDYKIKYDKLVKEVKLLKHDQHEARMSIEEYQRKEARRETLLENLEQLKSDLTASESKTIDFKQRWEKSSLRVTEISNVLKKMKEDESKNTAQVETLVKRIEHLLGEATRNKESSNQQILNLNEKIKVMKSESVQQEDIMEDLQDVIRNSQTLVHCSEEAIAKLKEQYATKEKEFFVDTTCLQAELDGMRKEKAEREETTAQCAEELKFRKEENEELGRLLEALKEEKEEKECRNEEVHHHLEKQVKDMKEENEKLTQIVEALRDEKRAVEIRESEGRAHIIELEGKKKEAERSFHLEEKKRKEIEAKRHEEERIITCLKVQIESLKSTAEEREEEVEKEESREETLIANLKEEVETLKNVLKERERDKKSEDEASLEERKALIESLTGDLSSLKRKLESKENDLKLANFDCTTKDKTIASLKGIKEALESQLKEEKDKEKKNAISIESLQDQVESLKSKLQGAEEAGAAKDVEDKRIVKDLRVLVERLKSELEEKEKDEELAVAAFEEELSSIEEEKAEAEAEVASLKQQLLNLQLKQDATNAGM